MEEAGKDIQPKKQRNSAIELCRILAMLMITGCHFMTHGGFTFDKTAITVPKLWWYVLEMGGNFGVDVFVMISGYFLIRGATLETNTKRVLKLCGQACFYSIAIYLFAVLMRIVPFSAGRLLKAMFPIITGSWWFLTTYFVLFLLHPYLNRLLLSLEKRQYQYLLMMLLLIWCIIPTVTSFAMASNALLEFVLLYTIAGYVRLHGGTLKLKSIHFFLLWLLATVVTHASAVGFMLLGRKAAVFADRTLFFYDRHALPTLLRAFFFFMTFQRMNIPNNRIINTVSSAAFGVYLIHDSNIIRPLLWKTLFVNRQYQDSCLLIPYSIGVVLLVYAACTLIDLLRIKTVEAVYVRMIDRHIDRITAPMKRIAGWFRTILFGKE